MIAATFMNVNNDRAAKEGWLSIVPLLYMYLIKLEEAWSGGPQ